MLSLGAAVARADNSCPGAYPSAGLLSIATDSSSQMFSTYEDGARVGQRLVDAAEAVGAETSGSGSDFVSAVDAFLNGKFALLSPDADRGFCAALEIRLKESAGFDRVFNSGLAGLDKVFARAMQARYEASGPGADLSYLVRAYYALTDRPPR